MSVTVEFQGIVCGPQFEFSRSAGLEADHGFVHIDPQQLGPLAIREALLGVETLTARTFDKSVRGQGLLSVGDLIFREEVDRERHEVELKKILLAERSVEAPFASDDDNAVFRVELTDIRSLWSSRGMPLFGGINVPRQGESDELAQASAANNAGGPLSGLSGPTTATGGILPPLIPSTMRNGAAWTLRQVLEERVLPALPGTPVLNRIPIEVEGRAPVGHFWDGTSPKEALRKLLAEFQLVLTLDLDSNVSLWSRGEGELTERRTQRIKFDTSEADCDPRVANARALASIKRVPAVVVVLGPPIIVTERAKLEPVGIFEGEVMHLREAMEKIGLDMESARILAMLRHDDRLVKATGISTAGLSEFQRWAWKSFRLEGGTKTNATRLPILEGRAEVDGAGALQPPRVFSETHSFINKPKASVSALMKAGVDPSIAKLRVAGEQGLAKHLGRASPSAHIVGVNHPFAEQASGFHIDRDRGIVHFQATQGLLKTPGQSPEESRLASGDPNVVLEFSYKKKGGFDEDLLLAHRYHSIWVRRSENGARLEMDQVAAIPAGSAPLVIVRKELQQLERLDGKSNKADLDAIAEQLARDVLGAPQVETGAIVTFGRPVPVDPNGRVLSITWSLDSEERPRTVAHLGMFPPLAPPAPPPRDLPPEDPTRDSPITPRGMRS